MITLSGIMSAGKSTVIERLKRDQPSWSYFSERLSGPTLALLERVYQGEGDKHNLGLKLQCAILARSLSRGESPCDVLICEREPADASFFLPPMLEHDMIDSEGAIVFSDLLEALRMREPRIRKVRILLDVSVETALERIAKRERPGEDRITSAYLRRLRDEHLRSSWDAIIDANRPADEVAANVMDVIGAELATGERDY